jgi:MFS family permease
MAIIPGESAPPHLRGTAMGFNAAVGEMLGAGLMPVAVGWIADRVGLGVIPWVLLVVAALFCVITLGLRKPRRRCWNAGCRRRPDRVGREHPQPGPDNHHVNRVKWPRRAGFYPVPALIIIQASPEIFSQFVPVILVNDRVVIVDQCRVFVVRLVCIIGRVLVICRGIVVGGFFIGHRLVVRGGVLHRPLAPDLLRLRPAAIDP